jgi:hypothetical protein
MTLRGLMWRGSRGDGARPHDALPLTSTRIPMLAKPLRLQLLVVRTAMLLGGALRLFSGERVPYLLSVVLMASSFQFLLIPRE